MPSWCAFVPQLAARSVGPNEDEEPGGPVRPKVTRSGLAGRESVITCRGTGRRRFRRVIVASDQGSDPDHKSEIYARHASRLLP
jgi:hypothetical protein